MAFLKVNHLREQGRRRNALYALGWKPRTVTSVVVCWSHRPTLIQGRRGLHRPYIPRRKGSVEVTLEAGPHSWTQASPECRLHFPAAFDVR